MRPVIRIALVVGIVVAVVAILIHPYVDGLNSLARKHHSHRVVLHVHCVNTIAWAVRQDAPVQLEHQLDGLRWQWISYVPSGLPLAWEIEKVLSVSPDTDVLVLGNHGLVIGGNDCGAVEDLLSQVQQRPAICPRQAGPTDYAALAEIADGSSWDLPDDDAVHALGTDAISRAVLSGGLRYPCQSIFSTSSLK